MTSAGWILPLAFELVFYQITVNSCPLKCSCKDMWMHCNMDDLRSLETMSHQNITNMYEFISSRFNFFCKKIAIIVEREQCDRVTFFI